MSQLPGTKTRLFKDLADPEQRWCLSCWCMEHPLHFEYWAVGHRLLINHRHAKRAAGNTYRPRKKAA